MSENGATKIGSDPVRERLYLPNGKRGQALQTLGMFKRVRRMEIIGQTMADDRVLRRVLITFRNEGLGYEVKTPAELLNIMQAMYQLYEAWTAKGQSKVVTMADEK